MDLLQEDKICLTDLAKERDVSVSTVWRWCIRGVRGVRLESYNEGARRWTTREAHSRFVAATTAAAQAKQPAQPWRTNRQREAAIKRAERECQDLGI